DGVGYKKVTLRALHDVQPGPIDFNDPKPHPYLLNIHAMFAEMRWQLNLQGLWNVDGEGDDGTLTGGKEEKVEVKEEGGSTETFHEEEAVESGFARIVYTADGLAELMPDLHI
ncbi:hypothetical protein HK097_005070, partial [Rhizophlyctis rosea]